MPGFRPTPLPSSTRAIEKGVGYGMKYIEIYQNDVLNLPAEIAFAHGALLGSAGPAAPKAPTGLHVAR